MEIPFYLIIAPKIFTVTMFINTWHALWASCRYWLQSEKISHDHEMTMKKATGSTTLVLSIVEDLGGQGVVISV